MPNQKKSGQIDRESLAGLVESNLPGWRLAPKSEAQERPDGAVQGPSIEDLRRKFGIGQQTPSPAGRSTVRVEPEGGGPGKVADIVNGKIQIVQG